LNYRANQADSNYYALILDSTYRSKSAVFKLSYTWSHAIDNQSDPLLGNFFDLGFSNQTDRVSTANYYAGFTQEYDPNSDRGNADFDQRQALTAYGTWQPPKARKWTIAGIYAIRAGLPYTVFVGGNCQPICNTRANLNGSPLLSTPEKASGGEVILNENAFAAPLDGTNGNLGRNSFRGPGFYDLDLSIGREWRPRWMGEFGQIRVRADAFNILNHANFNNPQAFRNAPNFGLETKGRIEVPGFPSLTPLNETPRQIELRLRIDF
jgi:hypothetical protein